MTLPTSGPISLTDFATEYGVAASTPFPSGYYSKPGIPPGGPFSFSGMYGKSNVTFTLTYDTNYISANGYNNSDQANITSTVATSFTFTRTQGAGTYMTGPTTGTSTYVRVTNPGTGTGEFAGTIRVTAANGDYVDINYQKSYGNV